MDITVDISGMALSIYYIDCIYIETQNSSQYISCILTMILLTLPKAYIKSISF